jgi:translation initiation factor 2 subunit 1
VSEGKQMALRQQDWPEPGDLIIATVESVTDYGAYVKLDEFDKRGLLHVSEISSSWIRNIRDFVREGQKVVLKVLRVDVEKGHIDLSLRRVTKREKIEKIMVWKKERKAEALLRGVSEKTGVPVEELYEKVGKPLEEEYGLYDAFEKAVREGSEFLTKMAVSENVVTAFVEVAQERIRVPMVSVKGTIEVRCGASDGVKIIREAFANAKKGEKLGSAKVRFYVVAAPKYSVEVLAEDYKRAEDVFEKVSQNVVSGVSKCGGQGSFKRDK